LPTTVSCLKSNDKPQKSVSYHLDPKQEVIAKVLGKSLSVTDAATELGVSRQSVYDSLNKASKALKQALEPSKPGPAPKKKETETQGISKKEYQRVLRENLSLQAIKIILLAFIRAAGLLPDLRYQRLPAEL
jgi:transposase